MSRKDRTSADNIEQQKIDVLNQSVFSTIPAQIAILDQRGTVTATNAAWSAFAHKNNSAAAIRHDVGINYLQAGPGSDGSTNAEAQLEQQGIQSVLSGESKHYVHEYVCHSDAQQHWFSISVTPLQGPEGGALITHTDITEIGAAERALRDSHQALEARVLARTSELARANQVLLAQIKEREKIEARFRGLVDTAPDAMVIVNESGAIELINARTEMMFGYQRDELVGQSVEQLMAPSLRAGHKVHRQQYAQAPQVRAMGQGLELNALTKDGRELPVEISLSPLRGESGTLISAAIRDVSERRHNLQVIEAAKEEAERANSAKSRFLAFASHDLRQPLQALGIYLDVLQNKVDQQDALAIIGDMNRSLETMGALLNALLDISKLEAKMIMPEIVDFPVQDLLQRVFADASAHIDDEAMSLRVVPCSVNVRTDPTLLEQIVRNFVTNAIRYTDAGRVLLGCRRRGNSLSIEVWDTGIGITDDSLDTIFEDFVQLDNAARDRNKGLGLGLAIVKRTADLLGHPVDVRSRLGKGSVFSVQVPMGSVHAEVDDRELMTTGDASANAQIFLVDDDPDIVHATQLLLEFSGFDVVTAYSAEEALQQLETTSLRPNLLLCDYRLPDEATGVQLIQQIRDTLGDEHLPAIISTGDTSPARLRDTASIACEVLHKPVRGDVLICVIRRLLEGEKCPA